MDERNTDERNGEELLWVWMSLLGKPVNKAIRLVFDCFKDPETAWNESRKRGADGTGEGEENEGEDSLLREEKEKPIFYGRLRDESLKEKACRIVGEAQEKGIRIIIRTDPLYPEKLLHIYNPPPVLYCIGRLPKEADPEMTLLSVVGSRTCTHYGRNWTYKICRELAAGGVGIVSGLARGIDISAHMGALDGDGYTLAVLGGGPDVIYPPEHRKVYERITEKGCIVSEHPPGTEPLKTFFPARNRIIAGMTDGTFVTEAGKSSGAMITVERALEEGRDVFALPGNVDSPASEGTNRLIKSGGICVTGAGDIIEALNLFDRFKNEEKEEGGEETFRPLPGLSDAENAVYKQITEGVGRRENISENTGLSPGEISAAVTKLELKGLINVELSGIITQKFKNF